MKALRNMLRHEGGIVMADPAAIIPHAQDWVSSLRAAESYWIDAWQRSVLFFDTLRQRGDIHAEQAAKLVPHVLSFEAELVLDGRTLERPVNYLLVRIRPPKDVTIDRTKRPFIIFDPRAGHGPGIGGMKQDSEIGVAIRAGHPCYFVGFLPAPVPGQTIEDVCIAEGRFIERVVEIETQSMGKPCLIGNCQAGWQIMLMASIRPDLPGPIILAGSPLSYWAGVRGKNPLRYLGGALGGTWLTALAGDLGHGIFDGANLIANFESMNPANTYWQKAYNVYSRIDTEPQRFLEFETWWGSPVLLNAQEMEWIADNLFVGNKLAEGTIATSDGRQIDLRSITSPIIVFCSWGDDITPPQQALGWILDLYQDLDQLISAGQTIVYTIHQSIGHLGIFVSGKVASKEHNEFASCIEMIDLLPPGLYEAIVTQAGPDLPRADLIEGGYLLTLEPRTLDDIRALGTNSAEDEARFATVAQVSRVNKLLYRKFIAPVVRATTTEQSAEWLRAAHPHRLRFSAISSQNPFSPALAGLAERVRSERRPVGDDNLLRQMETAVADQIASSLKIWGEMRDMMVEQIFLATYGSPWLQALAGISADDGHEERKAMRSVIREASARNLQAGLEQDIAQGDLVDAVLRAAIYIARGGARGGDERSFTALKAVAADLPAHLKVGHDRFKAALRKQYLTLRLNERKAIQTLASLLPSNQAERQWGFEVVRALMESRDRTEAERRRFEEIARIFEASGTSRRAPAA
jgi:hypothetical protein